MVRWLGGAAAFALTAAGVLAFTVIVTRHQLSQPDRVRFAVRGIDVSHHQGRIDWPTVARAQVQFAFIKATEGADHPDREFGHNWEASAAAGIARGAYHYFSFCSPGGAQAAHFIALVPPGQRMLPPAVDVELAGSCASPPSGDDIRRELHVLLGALTNAYGRAPILYTTNAARLRLLKGEFDDFPLWIRNVYTPPWLFGVDAWAFWQHNDEGRVPGVSTPVDLNVFHGDRAMLQHCLRTGECRPLSEAGDSKDADR